MKITVLTPTFNEKDNIKDLYLQIKDIFTEINYQYEHLVIDNASNDGTIPILKEIASKDKNFKVIINNKNYGHIRSPFYGLQQCNSDAVILMASDFQDPVDLIPRYIKEWEKGNKIILGEKITSNENKLKSFFRKLFYKFLNKISDIKLTNNTTGSGIFDKSVIDKIKNISDPYPYFRGLINEIGEEVKTITFNQPSRKAGLTNNNIFTLYDIGILGIVKHSRKPLRFMVLLGFVLSLISFTTGLFYLIYKLIYWDSFSLGLAPIIVGIFLVSSVPRLREVLLQLALWT